MRVERASKLPLQHLGAAQDINHELESGSVGRPRPRCFSQVRHFSSLTDVVLSVTAVALKFKSSALEFKPSRRTNRSLKADPALIALSSGRAPLVSPLERGSMTRPTARPCVERP